MKLKLLTKELTPKYTTPLPHLARARLLTGAQLDRLLAEPGTTPATTGRVRRRIMTRLHQLGLVMMLARRIGGVRAGSAGHIYTLTTAGRRFLALINGEPEPARVQPAAAPGDPFLTHALTVSGIYVDLTERTRGTACHVHAFATEPQCWHPTGSGGFLRPDAYTVLRTGNTGDCWWLEIDESTETVPRLRAKLRVYRDFFTGGGTGPDGVPPRLLFTAGDQARADAVARAAGDVDPASGGEWVTVTTHGQAAGLLITELHATE